jgi:hypothetical protein
VNLEHSAKELRLNRGDERYAALIRKIPGA